MTSLAATATPELLDAVVLGLSRIPKSLPCRFFYDREGSLLFERICGLPEYYLTRTEDALLREHADAIAGELPAGAELVELGSGSSRKTRRLLEAVLRRQPALRYIPVDISGEMLSETARALSREYPRLEVAPLAAEYFGAMERLAVAPERPKVILFLGSNLGNFTPTEAVRFLRRMRALMGGTDRLLLGLDMRKDPAVLHAAYNDSSGVTAAFNLNLLGRLNRELGTDFALDAFRHRAVYNGAEGRVEMHLVSMRAQTVRVNGRRFSFEAGEAIHTENSYKYTLAGIDALAEDAELQVTARWLDAQRWFSVNLLAPV